MITKPATEKQINFLYNLRGEAMRRIAARLNEPMVATDERQNLIVSAALVAALPEPPTTADASEMIDALKGNAGGMTGYARRRRDWGDAILAQVVQILGDDPAQWMARLERDPRYVREHRPGGEVAMVRDGEAITQDSLWRTFRAIARDWGAPQY